jgi:hypothetical protein
LFKADLSGSGLARTSFDVTEETRKAFEEALINLETP